MNVLRIPDIDRGEPFEIEINGENVLAYEGETVATVLLACGKRSLFEGESLHFPSRVFCNMGVCQQCLLTIDDQPNCQACKTLVKPGMKVETHS